MNDELPVKAVRGRNGWLFLANDTNDVLGQTTGEVNLDAREVRGYRRALDYRRAWLAERGIPYLFVVVPNKETAYAEHLPEGLTLSEDRWARRVERELDRHGPRGVFHYLFQELAVAKYAAPTFPKTDHHWNDHGALAGARSVVRLVGSATDRPVPALDDGDLETWESADVGDLAAKLDPTASEAVVHAHVRAPRSRLLVDNLVTNRGRTQVWESAQNRAAGAPRAVVFHDSFFQDMGPFLAESFARVYAAHTPTLDFEVVEQEQPDIVLTIAVERMAMHMPNDAKAWTTAETIARKQEADDRCEMTATPQGGAAS